MARQFENENSMRTRRSMICAVFALCIVAQANITSGYVIDRRWDITASGSTGSNGMPATFTWSLVPDGTPIHNEGPSNLIAYFDGLFEVTSGGSDLTQRPWFELFEQSFDRWTELGGITFLYEPSEDGAIHYNAPGVLGVRGDTRIGGAFLDGPRNTLAITRLYPSGDMVIDTGETSIYSNSSHNYRELRNTLMHEIGHAFGLLHIKSSTDELLMEGELNSSFDGPQLDDIRGLQSLYGDAIEKTHGGLGNGTTARAYHLGSLAPQSPLDIGSDATGTQTVAAHETDFVSIANSADLDFYSFTIDAPSLLDVSLTPLGGVFYQAVENGTESPFNANARSDLALAVFGPNDTTILGSANRDGAGTVETIADLPLETAGKYFVRVTGASANVQMYQLQLTSTLIQMLAGDYNSDGVVDAIDYSVWRDSLGQTGAGLAADGSGDGVIDVADYNVWKNNFGATAGSGGSTSGAVPEPSALASMLLTLVGMSLARRPRPL